MYWFAVLVLLAQLNFPLAQQQPAAPNTVERGRAARQGEQEAAGAQIVNPSAEYEFGQQITFQARISGDVPAGEMVVFITPEGLPTVWEEMGLDSRGRARQQVDTRRLAIAPFSRVYYRFEARLEDGSTITSETYWFEYQDNRFIWQSQESGIFRVYWYSGDLTLGQEIINVAQQGLLKAQNILLEQPPEPLRIYAYTSTRELQSALQVSGQTWIAGQANPELGIILISVPSGPEKKLELERKIPHEIAHLLQYKMVGESFVNQPIWLIEGMASLAELYPNPEYRRVLEATVQSRDMIPFNELCAAFPREANNAFRAYAQSESFVSYLYGKFGAEKLRKLIVGYQDGLSCDDGFIAVYGVSLAQMEHRWKQEVLGIDTGRLALQNLSPYLLLSLLVIIPASLALLPYHQTTKPEGR